MSALAPTARTREAPGGDEEAGSELKLGEFQHIQTLSLSEARLLINVVMDKRKQQQMQKEGRVDEEKEYLAKVNDHLEIFARFKDRSKVEAVELLLAQEKDLEPFERSQLGSLCCESADEAKTLIPSLVPKRTDEKLQDLIDEIARIRNIVD